MVTQGEGYPCGRTECTLRRPVYRYSLIDTNVCSGCRDVCRTTGGDTDSCRTSTTTKGPSSYLGGRRNSSSSLDFGRGVDDVSTSGNPLSTPGTQSPCRPGSSLSTYSNKIHRRQTRNTGTLRRNKTRRRTSRNGSDWNCNGKRHYRRSGGSNLLR